MILGRDCSVLPKETRVLSCLTSTSFLSTFPTSPLSSGMCLSVLFRCYGSHVEDTMFRNNCVNSESLFVALFTIKVTEYAYFGVIIDYYIQEYIQITNTFVKLLRVSCINRVENFQCMGLWT